MKKKFDFKILSRLRKKQSFTIKQLAKEAGLSYSSVAGIERNKIIPNLDTLCRISNVLGMKVSELVNLAETNQLSLMPKPESLKLNGLITYRFLLEDMEFIFAYAPVALLSDKKFYTHPNLMCFVYVVRGLLKIVLDDKEQMINQGELFSFNAGLPHYFEANHKDTQVIIIRKHQCNKN